MHIIVIDENRIFEMRLKERHTDLLIHAFGIADNIYEQKQSYVCFHYDAHSHWAFLSDDPSVRERMILYCKKMFQKKFSETKLYCIDSIENRDDAVTMNQAFCRKDTAKIILIQDASRFYEREYELKIHEGVIQILFCIPTSMLC
jgi:hypothetical protein